jgi:hypothetical protein
LFSSKAVRQSGTRTTHARDRGCGRVAFGLTILFLLGSTSVVAAAESKRTIVIVVGTGGSDEYTTGFNAWADDWETAAAQPDTDVVRIGSTEKTETPDRDVLKSAVEKSIAANDSELWIVLIGHGTFNGRAARFNLRGPDVAATELAAWLVTAKMPMAVVNCTSSSAPFINALSGPNRVIVTATKNGVEQNYCRFGSYISKLIANPIADLDKDGQTSLLEAWLMASRQTGEFYTSESRLATEHALLDDDGDGKGSREDGFRGVRPVRNNKSKTADGFRAHQFHLVRSERERNMPAKIRKKRDEIEIEVIKLRERRDDIGNDDAYFALMEPLMVQLASIYEQADQHADGTSE